MVPIADPAVKQRIHQTYQIGYLKDVVLPRVLDDQTFAALSSLMLFYNHDVLTSLQAGVYMGMVVVCVLTMCLGVYLYVYVYMRVRLCL